MKDSIERDRRLLANLDSILAGKESEIAETIDDDTRTVLDVASRMTILREIPSKEYTKNLKAELVHRLAEEEKKALAANRGFLFWQISQKTKWQGTIAAIILIIIIAIIILIVLLINQLG